MKKKTVKPKPKATKGEVVVQPFDFPKITRESIVKTDALIRAFIAGAGTPSRWSIQLAAYERATTRNYEALRISALGGVDTDDQSLKLSGLYVSPACETTVFTTKLLSSEVDEFGVTSKHGQITQSSRPSESILTAICDPEKLRHIILGAAGTGKSSILRYLCLEWAKGFAAKKPTMPVPIMVELREFLGAREEHKFTDLFAYLTSESGRGWFFDADTLLQKLKSGEAWLLVDGIDEAFATHVRKEICDWLRSFSKKHPEVRIIASSRSIGFEKDDWDRPSAVAKTTPWEIHTLLPFDDDRIRQFVEKWFSHLPSGKESNRFGSEDVVRILKEREFLRPLAEVPLTLTMICAVRSRGIEPDSRCAVFKEAAKLFLQSWDNARGLPKEEADIVRHWRRYGESARLAFFRSVALRMVRDGSPNNSNQITHGALRTILQEQFSGDATIDAAALADGILRLLCERNFLLTELPGGGFGFFHRAFLEYFVADAWADEFGNDSYEDPKGEKQPFEVLFGEVIAPRWKDPTWHDTLRFLFGLLRPVPALRCLDLLANQEKVLVDKDKKITEPLGLVYAVDFLQEVELSFAQGDAGKKKAGAAWTKLALAEAWKKRVFTYSRSAMDYSPEQIGWRRRALVALAANLRGKVEVAWEAAALLRVKVIYRDLDRALGEALAVLAPGRSEIFWHLLGVVRGPLGVPPLGGAPGSAHPRGAIAPKGGTPNRMGAVSALAAGWAGEPETKAVLLLVLLGVPEEKKAPAQQALPPDADDELRRRAAWELGRRWKGDADAKAALLRVLIGVSEPGKEPASQVVPPDSYSAVRWNAGVRLGEGWEGDAEVKAALERVATGTSADGSPTEDDENVREIAKEALDKWRK